MRVLNDGDTKEAIRDMIREVHKQALSQEDILGHPNPVVFIPFAFFILVSIYWIYKAYTAQVVLGSLSYLFYLMSLLMVVGVIAGINMSTGYRVLITPKKIMVYHKRKEIFSAPLKNLQFRYDMKVGYSKLELRDTATGASCTIYSLQFKEMDKLLDKLKKIRSLFSKRK